MWQILEISGNDKLLFSMEKSQFNNLPKCELGFHVLLLCLRERGRATLVENFPYFFSSTVLKKNQENFLLVSQIEFKEVSVRGHEPAELALSSPWGLEISIWFSMTQLFVVWLAQMFAKLSCPQQSQVFFFSFLNISQFLLEDDFISLHIQK